MASALRDDKRFVRWAIADGISVTGTAISNVVLPLGLLSATAFVFSDAAVFGAVPALVGTDRLAAANGFLGSMISGAEIVGPALGGVLAATIGATNAVWFDSASFFVAAAIQGSIRSTFRVGEPPSGRLQVRAQIKRALQFVRGNRSVATLLFTGFGNSVGFGAVVGLLVPYAVEQLSLPEGNFRVGILYCAYGAGALVSGLLFARVVSTRHVRWITPLSIGLSSAIAVGLVVSTNWRLSGLLLLLFSWSVTTTITPGRMCSRSWSPRSARRWPTSSSVPERRSPGRARCDLLDVNGSFDPGDRMTVDSDEDGLMALCGWPALVEGINATLCGRSTTGRDHSNERYRPGRAKRQTPAGSYAERRTRPFEALDRIDRSHRDDRRCNRRRSCRGEHARVRDSAGGCNR